MHESITAYLSSLKTHARAPATRKAIRADLSQFVGWWEQTYHRPFGLDLLSDRDLRAWKATRQVADGMAPATINRALSSIRQWCDWARTQQRIEANPALLVDDVPHTPLAPRSIPDAAVDALLRAAHTIPDPTLRLRDQALLALLVYAGLRSQEVCDSQLRDLDLAGGSVTVRHGKGGHVRRIPLHPDAHRLLRQYLHTVRCPAGLPPIGSDHEREPVLVSIQATVAGHPVRAGISTRLVRHRLTVLGHAAAQRVRTDAQHETNIAQRDHLLQVARDVETVSPHQLRHSLAHRLLQRGATLVEIQRILGHRRLSTTGIYLTPSDADLRRILSTTNVLPTGHNDATDA